MKKVLIAIALILGVTAFAQQDVQSPQQRYISRYCTIAVNEMYRSGVPASLRQMIEVMVHIEEEIDQMENQFAEPYLVKVDYNSQVQFSGVAEVSFSFDFQTPWQKFEKPFTVTVEIKGLDQQ